MPLHTHARPGLRRLALVVVPALAALLLAAGPASADVRSFTNPAPIAASAQGGAIQACAPTATRAQLQQAGRVCRSAADLNDLLRSGYSGRVIIPRDASWEMKGRDGKPLQEIPLKSGVQLVGERGALGSRPLLYTNHIPKTDEAKYSLFVIEGNDVRVEGLHFRGPKEAKDHKTRDPYVDAIRVVENAELRLGRQVVIADNEFEQWTHGGVYLIGSHGSVHIRDWNPAWQRLTRADADLVRIERNYMHHNVMDGGGYGVVVGGGAYGTVEGNVFDFNRHAVAASGKAYSGYVARFNYVLQGGYMQHNPNKPDFHNQHFDVHGTGKDGYGGYAGDYFQIALNTIRGEQGYFAGTKTRPAFTLRGRPAQGAYFRGNVLVHDDLDEAVALKPGSGIGESHTKFNFHAGENRFDADHSAELAAGDFDHDGRTDAFVANGTAWFYSRAGIRPWEYLRPSTKRIGELAFADIDNDGVSDVLYRDPSGKLGYVKSGTAAPVTPLTSLPVPIKDLRFGDFDGDGLTDMFYTRRNQWQVWYGRTRAWTAAQTSSQSISGLLFGEFDDVRGTDVAAVTGRAWSYSSASTQGWAKLNGKLMDSFAKAVAADFDGNGKTDIAFGDGQRWRYSRDGRSPTLAVLREGSSSLPYAPLNKLLIGRFDGGTRDLVLTMGFKREGSRLLLGERTVIWNGRGSGGAFSMRSSQNMR